MATSPAIANSLVLEAFEAMAHSTVILDREGRIAAVNEAWRSFGLLNGATVTPDVGDSYLAACNRGAAAGEESAARAAREIRRLLASGSGTASVTYPCHAPESQRWFEAQAVGFPTADGNCALVIHQDVTAREQARAALDASERTLRAVIEALPVGLWTLDASGRIVHGNPAGKRIWAGERLVGPERFGEYKGWWVSTGEPIAPEDWAAARAIRLGETSIDEEIEIECFDGSRKFILNSALPLRGESGEIEGAIIVNADVTEATKARAALRESEHKWRTLFDLLPVGASVVDSANRIVEHNTALERILALTPPEMKDRKYRKWRFLGPGGAELGESRYPSARARRTHRPVDSVELTVEREDGSRISTLVSAAPLPQPPGSVVVVTYDISARVRAREGEAQARAELERTLREQTELARTDYLTQAASRREFFQVAERELALARRHDHAVSVVLLDIDHFKAINDRYGHDFGDQVLKSAVTAMKESLRSTDTLARYGGEEFVVLLPYTGSTQAGQVAEHLRTAVAARRVVAGSGVAEAVTISAGVATLRPGDSVDTLLRRADNAMYAAKAAGRDRVVIAADEVDE